MKKLSVYRICREAFPDGNPEWRAPYDHIKEWTDDAIAFEFLRRNPDYWGLWEQVSELDAEESNRGSRGLEPSELQERYDRLKTRGEEEFGVWQICDPRQPIGGKGILPWTVAASLSARYAYAVSSSIAHSDYGQYLFGDHSPSDTITIDLRARGPVEPQVEFVRWILNLVRAWTIGLEAPRLQRPLYGEYLRLLDARDDGASFQTIAKELYPREDGAAERVRKRLKAARGLRDGGYRDILLWGKIHIPDSINRFADPWRALTNLAERGDHEGFEALESKLFPPKRPRKSG
jgi:type VI secretion system activator RovC-like protein/transcriptional regulator